MGVRVLITNIQLTDLTGTEQYVRDLAIDLLRRGHEPIVYAPRCGATAEVLRAATIPVFDDLAHLAVVPDVIHAQHTLEAAVATLRFPGVPVVFASHSSTAWFDASPRLSAIRLHVAVDEAVRDRLVLVDGVDPNDVRVVHNGIDLARFRPRPTPLPARPRRALVFSNYTASGPWVDQVASACQRAGIALDIAGAPPATPIDRPEAVLPEYDLVFAKARCAMEALAVGCAVVVCDFTGVAGIVRADDLDTLRARNFGVRTMVHPHSEVVLDAAIAAYDPQAAAAASERYRAQGGLAAMVDDLLAVYADAIDAPAKIDEDADARRLASLFGPASADRMNLNQERYALATLRAEMVELRAQVAAAHEADRRIAGLEAMVHELDARRAAMEADLDAVVAERDEVEQACRALSEERDAIVGTRTWRVRSRLLPAYQLLRRLTGSAPRP